MLQRPARTAVKQRHAETTMDQAASTPNPLSALERLQHWWRRLAASVFALPGEPGSDPATAHVVDEIRKLVEDSRAQRGGEISVRSRAERIAETYRRASLPQRSAILNLITHEFAPDRDALERAIAGIRAAANDAELSHAEARLRAALDHPRAKFLAQFNLLPDGVEGPVYPSEVVVSHDGRHLWTANRGHDSIAVLALDETREKAELVTTVPCGGHWPRDLALDPAGRRLYAANERSGDVTWFDIDPETGVPRRAGSLDAPAASCVIFA